MNKHIEHNLCFNFRINTMMAKGKIMYVSIEK